MIITQHASAPPIGPSTTDYAVGRVLWALTDGLAARHFADLVPVPPFKWLEPLAEPQFGHHDLRRFGVEPKQSVDSALAFSMVDRPSSYQLSVNMQLAPGLWPGQWDDVMIQLARWLCRHLGNPALILWIANGGGSLHPHFQAIVVHKLDELARLERDGNQEELDRLVSESPDLIPSDSMKRLWNLVLSGRLKTSIRFDLYGWFQNLRRSGFTPSSRIELMELLTPRALLRPTLREFNEEMLADVDSEKNLVDWDIVLSVDHAHSAFQDSRDNPAWAQAIPELVEDATKLLRDAMDLRRELGGADHRSDQSYIFQPSISKHEQNKDFYDWTVLIEIARDSFLANATVDPNRARIAAESWWITKYPVFKRLALFAASHSEIIDPQTTLEWLLSEDGWWVWSVETEREILRLFVAIGSAFSTHDSLLLQDLIVAGPPREMFRDDVEDEGWQRIVDREVWLRVAKLIDGEAELSERARTRFDEISVQHPDWSRSADEQEEFPFWMGDGEDWREFIATPEDAEDLARWLEQHPITEHGYSDDWSQRCREKSLVAAEALNLLALNSSWPDARWREALQVWSEEDLVEPSWSRISETLTQAPASLFIGSGHAISSWLRIVAVLPPSNEARFLDLCERMLQPELRGGVDADEPVTAAINHPVGKIIEAIVRYWYKTEPQAGDGLPDRIKEIFTRICDVEVVKFRHGRVILSAHMVSLFNVDPEWTGRLLAPLLDWSEHPSEASACWEGFLWSPRLYRPLLTVIKDPLLESASHYDGLRGHADQYVSFLTFIALDPGDTFSLSELEGATANLPLAGLAQTASTLSRAMEGSGDHRASYWENRIKPYLQHVWPKSEELITPQISESFARLCVNAGDAFPQAVQELRRWLVPTDHPDYLVHMLNETTNCDRFPEESLALLDSLVADDCQWVPRDLNTCLTAISDSEPPLSQDPRYVRLGDLVRRRGT